MRDWVDINKYLDVVDSETNFYPHKDEIIERMKKTYKTVRFKPETYKVVSLSGKTRKRTKKASEV